MNEILKQIQREEEAPVRNCKIGVIIQCHPDEVREAVGEGKHKFKRKASYRQRHPAITGCEHYSLEEVTIFYDEEGRAIDYDMPYADPDKILDFTLVAGLVPYGTDLQGVFTGTSEEPSGEGEWEEVGQQFNSLLHTVQQANRELFPPDRIMVDGKPHEVAAVSICNNLKCIYNSGRTSIAPFPMVSK